MRSQVPHGSYSFFQVLFQVGYPSYLFNLFIFFMNKLQSSASYQIETLNSGNTKYFLDHKLFLKKILDESATLCVVYECVYITEQENVSAWWH